MGRLHKSYEISLWKDVLINQNFEEQRIAIIGSDSMSTLNRALTPKFKKNVNGSKELTFTMYSRYIDPISGEDTRNPFVDLIDNESKIKLKYRDKWYDFIVKDIQEDSSQNTKTYTATDQFIIELSKNGYNLVLDTSLMNNSGNLEELGNIILKDTGWTVEVPSNPKQYITEQLVEFIYNGTPVYAFFSSCKEQPARFQYVVDLGEPNTENVYDKPTQLFIDMTGQSYTTDENAIKHGFSYPVGFYYQGISEYRANRIAYTHKSKLNPTLNRIVYSYNNGDVEGYTDTEYVTPNLIQNFVTNNTFKSTSGWIGSYIAPNEAANNNKGSDYDANIEVVVYDERGHNLVDAFTNKGFSESTTYTPYLHVKFPDSSSVVINSGFYDNRSVIKNLSQGETFVLLYKTKEKSTANFSATVGVGEYITSINHYLPLTDDQSFITFNGSHMLVEGKQGYDGYYYVIGTVNRNAAKDEKSYNKLKTQLFITSAPNTEIYFEDFQIFRYIPDGQGSFLLPRDSATEAIAQTTYNYYKVADNKVNPSAAGYRATAQEYQYCYQGNDSNSLYQPDYTDDKVLSIDVKQSNYFNAIQSLCETFEVWADFDITHDEQGKVLGKKVIFKENIEKPNHVGFRYGVNLKQSKRTIDSKQIVTKLIVPDNTNEFAQNGFCSIARAGANTSGENYIYDFSYYYNFNKLDRAKMHELLYRPKEEWETDELQGYYVQLSDINHKLNDYIDRYTNLAPALMQAEANKQVAESGKVAAEEKYKDLADTFLKATGYAHTGIPKDKEETVLENDTLHGYLVQLAEYYSAWKKYSLEEIQAAEMYDLYKQQNDDYLTKINELNKEKEDLNSAFYKRFYRFIQEGTWKDDKYVDNDKYYSDAVSTAANSALPKVTYSFSIIDLSQIPEYENFEFDLADKTWVEDSELFGDEREMVVITEITYALEEPDQTSVKIQNHRDQFASLFQKVTATTQSVQYAAGAWDKAANFANANPVEQAAFLQNALMDAETKLQNAGEQSVVWDKTGITVTDQTSPSLQLRIVGGAILMRDQDSKDLGWQTAISAEGINAKVVTSGRLNTNKVFIMHGNDPTFRWDAFGINAYSFDVTNGYLHGLDTSKGVRFDRFGIYGYDAKGDSMWHPNSMEDVEEKSIFALTWDGLYLKLGQGNFTEYYGYNSSTKEFVPGVFTTSKWHESNTKIGMVSKKLFNAWVTDTSSPLYNQPYYDLKSNNTPFAKVFAIGTEGKESLVIYDDGTLVTKKIKLVEGIEWTPDISPARSIYGPVELLNYPAPNEWQYKDIPDTDPGEEVDYNKRWHKIKGPNDVLQCRTDTAGAEWVGPSLISGRSIEKTEVWYSAQETTKDPSDMDNIAWSAELPTQVTGGEYIYTRYQDVYTDGTKSDYRYTVSCPGNEATQCYIENPIGNPISLDENDNTEIWLIARMFRGNEEIDRNGTDFNYTWYKNNQKLVTTTKTLTIKIGDLRDAQLYFEAERKI